MVSLVPAVAREGYQWRARVGSHAMLGFERRFVVALVRAGDERRRQDVEAFVDATLRAMPEHLRAGVLMESLALAGWTHVRYGWRRDAAMTALLPSLARSPIGVLRQYPRLFRSLVLFAEYELAPSA